MFNKIRQHYQISNDDYLKSIGPDIFFSSLIKGDLSTLKELVSTGKSGSFFYYTVDSKYLLKTISSSEFAFLKRILKNYYHHLLTNPNTYLPKYFGMHKIRFRMQKTMREKCIYFVIMANVFQTKQEIHERYDIKGSLYKRFTNSSDPSVAKKDLDLLKAKFKFEVNNADYTRIMQIISKDCEFFAQQNIIDYSLLLGINYKSKSKRISNNPQQNMTQSKISEGPHDNLFNIESEWSLLSTNKYKQVNSRQNDKTYFLGIIDILTNFNTKKKLEYIIKRAALGKTISAIPSAQYSQRFIKFIDDAFDDQSKIIAVKN